MPVISLTPPTPWEPVPLTTALMNSKINALITELQNAVVGGDWVNLVLESGYAVAGGITPKIRAIVGGGYEIVGWIAVNSGTLSATGQAQVAHMPAGITVPVRTSATAPGFPTGNITCLDIRVDGTIWANAASGSTNCTQIRMPVVKLPAA